MSPDDTTTKRCTKCGELKSLDQFSNDKDKKGGLASRCKVCKAERQRQYYVENREERLEYRKTYRANNRDVLRERNRQSYAKNRDARQEYARHYIAEHRGEKLAYARQYRAENRETVRERCRQYSANHPDVIRANTHARRARKAGNGGTYTAADLAAIRAAQTDKRGRLICWRCGKPIKDTPHLDHWVPINHGGTSDPGNLHYMHSRCNLLKGAKLPIEIGRLL